MTDEYDGPDPQSHPTQQFAVPGDTLDSTPAAPPERGRGRRALAGAALATGLAVGGAAIAVAATGSSPTTTPGASPSGTATAPGYGDRDGDGPHGGMGMGRGHGRMGGFGLGMRGALHGEATVKKADGTFQKVAMQSGEVTSVSASAITVKSEDGYSATYVVTGDTLVNATRGGIADVKKGHQVGVMATVSGSTRTATMVGDRTIAKDRLGDLRGRDGDGDGDGDGPDAPARAPSGSATTQSSSAL